MFLGVTALNSVEEMMEEDDEVEMREETEVEEEENMNMKICIYKY